MDTYDGEQRGYEGNYHHTNSVFQPSDQNDYIGHSEIDISSSITISLCPMIASLQYFVLIFGFVR